MVKPRPPDPDGAPNAAVHASVLRDARLRHGFHSVEALAEACGVDAEVLELAERGPHGDGGAKSAPLGNVACHLVARELSRDGAEELEAKLLKSAGYRV